MADAENMPPEKEEIDDTSPDADPDPKAVKKAPARKKREPAPTEPPPPPPESEMAGVQITNWEFIDKIPTREEVVALLETLPSVWGIKTVDYADYVQVLPQNKKVKVPSARNPRAMEEVFLACYTVYMSVAGRLKMLEAAATLHGWSVDFLPEMGVNPPGYLDFGHESGRIVYREYLVIEKAFDDRGNMHMADGKPVPHMLGRKPGTAWVPNQGGKQAAGSNPYEKVETSARGRALAAWGFGVLPGSGVASVEEVLGAAQNKAQIEREQSQGGGNNQRQGNGRVSRDEIMEKVFQVGEQVRQLRQWDVPQMADNMSKYLIERLALKNAVDEQGNIDWSKVSDGNLQLLANDLTDGLKRLQAQEEPV